MAAFSHPHPPRPPPPQSVMPPPPAAATSRQEEDKDKEGDQTGRGTRRRDRRQNPVTRRRRIRDGNNKGSSCPLDENEGGNDDGGPLVSLYEGCWQRLHDTYSSNSSNNINDGSRPVTLPAAATTSDKTEEAQTRFGRHQPSWTEGDFRPNDHLQLESYVTDFFTCRRLGSSCAHCSSSSNHRRKTALSLNSRFLLLRLFLPPSSLLLLASVLSSLVVRTADGCNGRYSDFCDTVSQWKGPR